MKLRRFVNPFLFPLHCFHSSWPLTDSEYDYSTAKNDVGSPPFSFPLLSDSTVFHPSLNETTDMHDNDSAFKRSIPVGNQDTQPKQSNCFSMVFGVPTTAISVLSVVVITTSQIQRFRSICSEVTALLSHYSCFCSFSVYPKEDYSFALSNTYCDFCITPKCILSEISHFYPDILMSYVDDSSVNVSLCRFMNH